MKQKNSNHLIKLVLTALFAALCCVATMIIKIPVPATGGYLNLGDGIVILSAWMLGPVYGALAAALGSALADIFAGYVQYAPATFIIKALMAVSVWVILRLFRNVYEKKQILSFIAVLCSGILAEGIMVGGYLFYEGVLLGYGIGAVASVIPNVIQGCAGIISGAVLISALSRTRIKDKFLS